MQGEAITITTLNISVVLNGFVSNMGEYCLQKFYGFDGDNDPFMNAGM